MVEAEVDTEDDDVEVVEAPRVRPRPTKRIKAKIGTYIPTQIPLLHGLIIH